MRVCFSVAAMYSIPGCAAQLQENDLELDSAAERTPKWCALQRSDALCPCCLTEHATSVCELAAEGAIPNGTTQASSMPPPNINVPRSLLRGNMLNKGKTVDGFMQVHARSVLEVTKPKDNAFQSANTSLGSAPWKTISWQKEFALP
eukprot:CAMPEP_0174314154 /NCGR_PEP_ID=MMETSP0810-20121108/5461_1 /TAXON_ID=73025 ORGANISM="Eutreptiella gymnastica-like, Strain CCMP1594" /NCGR_SAMPLE_ID=MMETSP0810 /ASSEMBLY_ACC=CAM_ASM_000659 /LENGTH=146 /DNA_ID=CAMNT_0015423173 /DNA_START=633 /DNA_END=1068 /DNA_ORIENTATION=-